MFEEIPEGPGQTSEVNEPAGTTAPSTEPEESDSVPDLSEVDFNNLYSAIEPMANLLCDPSSLKNSIREKIGQKTLPAEWADPDTAVVVMTAFATVSSAVEAMRTGARDCLTKPFALEELTTVVERADVALHFDRESRLLRERLRA